MAPYTFIGSQLGKGWQLAENQALRRKQDQEGLGRGQKGKEEQKKREEKGEMGRQNKPTIRGSSILIDFILQNATQLKVEKLAPLPQKKIARERSFNMFFLPQQQAFSNKLSLVQILQACITYSKTTKQQQRRQKTPPERLPNKATPQFSKLYKDFELAILPGRSIQETLQWDHFTIT